VKKLLLFFIFIYIYGCTDLFTQNKEITYIECPKVFFSSENNVYSSGKNENFDLDQFNYKASLNNYGFVDNCSSDLEYNKYNVDLLILVEPLNPKDENINMPIFVFLYNSNDELIDKQYFRVSSNLNYEDKSYKFITTEVIKKLNILIEVEEKAEYMTIGFVKIKY
tara:strand:+ start:15229 stop:15726 length:498 start_codon:yes stop_codon:yes gene_type:complete